jgi:protein O-GlcNAc transferase
MVDVALVNQLMTQMSQHLSAGKIGEAVEICRQITRLVPDSDAAFANFSTLLLQSGDADAAVEASRRAISLNPDFHGARVTLAAASQERGETAESIRHFNRAIELCPGQPKLRSNKIYAMEFLPGVSQHQLLLEQREWDRIHGSGKTICPIGQTIAKPKNFGRIKVGYVSSFFYHHAEAFFVVPLLESHDRSAFEIHCYSDVGSPDQITQRHQMAVDHWHDCKQLSNEQLAQKIHHDQIDILIDLMMHMGHNRAPMFALKPAPIQIAWLAYPGGTGMRAMDYRITDSIIDPPGNDDFYVEKSIRLPQCWCCYDPVSNATPVPTRPDRPITFGSLNNPRKLNEPILRVWAKAMQSVSGSRVIIQSISDWQRTKILSTFGSAGVSPDRIEFVGRLQRNEYLRQYDQIDIALDSLPYSGITTTCDALWMGVPVVTLAGNTAAGRAGTSVVTAASFPELAAESIEQFVGIATSLGNDLARLNRLRGSALREQCTASALMDSRKFAGNFESALQALC